MMKHKKSRNKIVFILAVALFIVGVFFLVNYAMQKKEPYPETKEEQVDKTEDKGEMKDGELIDYEAKGAVEMPAYKGLKVKVTPSEEDVYRQILLDAEDKASKVKSENADRVLKGDWISLDYVGYMNGQESEDLTETAAIICVGKEQLFNAAFDRALIGQKVGTDFSFELTFAQDYYDADVAGNTVTFSVKVNAKVNDEYVQTMTKGKYKTLEKYYAYTKQKEWEDNIEIAGETAWDEYMEKCQVKEYPKGSVKQALTDLKRQYTAFGELNGTSYEEIITDLGMTEEDVKELAKEEVKARMVAKSIAVKEKLTLSDADYEKYLLQDVEPEEEDDKQLTALETSYKKNTGVYPHDDMLIHYVKDYIGKFTKQE